MSHNGTCPIYTKRNSSYATVRLKVLLDFEYMVVF